MKTHSAKPAHSNYSEIPNSSNQRIEAGTKRNGGRQMKWPDYQLSRLAERFISGGTPNTKLEEYWHGDIPWITGADFNDGEVILGRRCINRAAVDNSATNIVPKGSILMVTRTGVGKIAIAPVDIAISQDITGVILKHAVSTSYVVAAIRNRMSVILAAQRGATIKGVTIKRTLRTFKFHCRPLPNNAG